MSSESDKAVAGCLIALIVIALIICGPLAVIWSLNTLFGLNIAYTFWTWLAALVLSGAVAAPASNNFR